LTHTVVGNLGCQPVLATSLQLVRLVGYGLKRLPGPDESFCPINNFTFPRGKRRCEKVGSAG